eukprot:SM000313S11960  [mRNA]  locus=s313:119465:123336:+ [translate_table: standard]
MVRSHRAWCAKYDGRRYLAAQRNSPLRELPCSGPAAVLGFPPRPPLAPPATSPDIAAVTTSTWKRLLGMAREHLRDFDVLTCHLERLMEPHAPSSPPLPCAEGEVPSTACSSEEPWLLLGSHSPPLSPCSASTISTETTTTRLPCDGALQSVWLEDQCALSLDRIAAKIRPEICDGVSHTEYADEASGAKRRRCPMIHDTVEDLCIGPNARKLKLPIKKMEIIVPESFDRKQVPDDGWSWRKYGKKPIKSSPHPRNYFRCSSEDYDDHPCPARKHVEISRHDSNVFLVTYRGRHSHNPPPSPVVVPLVTQVGGPPVDIGPQDQSAQVSAKRPSIDACKIDGAQGTLGPVPASSDVLDAALVGPLTTSKLVTHENEFEIDFDALGAMTVAGLELQKIEGCSSSSETSVLIEMPLDKSRKIVVQSRGSYYLFCNSLALWADVYGPDSCRWSRLASRTLPSRPSLVKVNINEKVLIMSPLTEPQDQIPFVIDKLALRSTNKTGFANLEKYINE